MPRHCKFQGRQSPSGRYGTKSHFLLDISRSQGRQSPGGRDCTKVISIRCLKISSES